MHTLRYDAGASAYDRLTGRWSRMYIRRALDTARVRDGTHVLDVATGTGFTDVTIELQTLTSRFTSFDGDFWEPIEAGGGRPRAGLSGLA